MTLRQSAVAAPVATSQIGATTTAYWFLRVGAAMCFIGHGAFGFITKAAWLPYFALVGINETWAYRLMPLVGTVDVVAGMAVLFAPRGLPLVYMAVWALWTALLRPLTGESFFEAVERAGNYGVPFALLLLTAMPRTLGGLFSLLGGPSDSERATVLTQRALKWATVLLVFGHGALAVTAGNANLPNHLAAIGLPSGYSIPLGWFEIALALAVAFWPRASLLIFIAVWKVSTEFMFVTAGAPVWEFVERFGSYTAPLALAWLTKLRRT